MLKLNKFGKTNAFYESETSTCISSYFWI